MPLLARIYPNGLADVNHFHAAGGMGFLIRELLDAGLLHEDVQTVWGDGLRAYTVEAKLGGDGTRGARAGAGKERRRKGAGAVRQGLPADRRPEGADGNLGHAVIKTSAVKPERQFIEAPAIVLRQPGGAATTPSRPASSTATSSPWCASRGRRPTACRNCTS